MAEPGQGADDGLGTRFLLYPQAPYVPGYDTPEVVWISTSPGAIQPGPADSRIYVRDPALDKAPYEYPYLPPYVGLTNAPATAGPDGHFDQIPRDTRQFIAAHAFAATRRVLDIWESYLRRPIDWQFASTYERLEVIPWLDWDNAQSGFGFLELGIERGDDGRDYPHALNFDTIAHEMGHAILFSLVGVPEGGNYGQDFGAFHEACADAVSLISFLHFDSGLDRLLRRCRGNLFTLNELNRIVELTGERQIRLASNSRRMSEVTSEVHDRSRPFTGAIFDTMAETYHGLLVEEGLAEALLLTVDLRNFDAVQFERIGALTASSFAASPFQFKSALARARDEVGGALVHAWDRLEANDFTLQYAASVIIEAAERENPLLAERFEGNFLWREIL